MESVLYVGCDIPDGNAAAIRVFSNSLALRDYGYKVNILSFDHNMDNASNRISIENYSGCTVYHKKYPSTKKEYLKYLVSIKEYVDVINRILESDILVAVVVYDQPAISFLKLKKFCKIKNIKLVCDCAEWHTAIHLKGVSRIIKMIDITLSMRYAYKKADGIIAISMFLFDYYSNRGLSDRVLRVPPLQNEKILRESFDSKPPRKYIYAGIAGRDKDCLDTILYAFSKLNDFVYSIELVGLKEDQCTDVWPETKEYIKRIREKSKVAFLGRLPHKTVLSHTANSDYCLLIRDSTRKNNAGFPTKYAESIECGTPVISTIFSDVQEYTEKYNTGILVGRKDNLERALRGTLSQSDEELEQLKYNCYCCNAFSYKTYINDIGEFIQMITKRQ